MSPKPKRIKNDRRRRVDRTDEVVAAVREHKYDDPNIEALAMVVLDTSESCRRSAAKSQRGIIENRVGYAIAVGLACFVGLQYQEIQNLRAGNIERSAKVQKFNCAVGASVSDAGRELLMSQVPASKRKAVSELYAQEIAKGIEERAGRNPAVNPETGKINCDVLPKSRK